MNYPKTKKMKNSIYGFLVLLFSIVIISACNKFGDLTGKTGQLVATSYKVKINEPDSLLLVGAQATDSIKWSVSPAGYDSLVIKKNAAVVVFKKAGYYQVKVTDNGGLPATASITVSDSVYHKPVTYTTSPLTGDQITLVPYYHNSADSSYISLVAQTKNYYCGISRLVVADSVINGKYGINFVKVVQPSPCVIGNSPISADINFTQNQPGHLANGTFPLSVTLNGTTYTGNIIVATSTISFNWNYTSGVLIARKQINR
ncbi:MAG: hypothetical protein JWP44_3101 [Mucilaginibacter sp.]|jgi:hypothetical protein|nr:hypothetical protein [Mucilaginibacter sp.]